MCTYIQLNRLYVLIDMYMFNVHSRNNTIIDGEEANIYDGMSIANNDNIAV